MYENIHIHERIDQILTILNSIPLRGFDQINGVSEAMKGLAALDRDIRQAEEKADKPKEPTEETD